MNEWNKVTDEHLRRRAVVYIRQSSPAQILDHKESTERQYHLAERAVEMGWKPDQVDILTRILTAAPITASLHLYDNNLSSSHYRMVYTN